MAPIEKVVRSARIRPHRAGGAIRRGFARGAPALASAVAFAVSIADPIAAGDAASVAATSPPASAALTPEEIVRGFFPSAPQVSRDGRSVAVVLADFQGEDKARRNIWVYDAALKRLSRFTTAKGSDKSPRWSPDGSILAFLSDRDEKTQIYRMPRDGGEAEAVTASKTDVEAFAWSPDGKSIAYLADEPPTPDEEKREKEKDDGRVVDRDDKPSRISVVDLATKSAHTVTKGPLRVSELDWLPSGDGLVVAATEDTHAETAKTKLYRVAVADGTATLVAAPDEPFGDLRVSPDGRFVAWIGARGADGLVAHDLFLLPLAGGAATNLTAALDRPIVAFEWSASDALVALVESGFDAMLVRISIDGRRESLAATAATPSDFAIGGDRIAWVGSTASQGEELWVGSLGAAAERVSHWNDALATKLAGPLERFTYRSFDGTPIEAGLLLPRDAKRPLATVVLVHGGPTGRFSDSLQDWAQLLATRGFAVLMPNVRGSIGYGLAFTRANRRDWGGADYKDVVAGVDALVARGVADPNRLGIAGWSYGGYMAAWAPTQTTRFKASVSGAPMTDLAAEWGTEDPDTNTYDSRFLGAPYENLETFTRFSPVLFAGRVKTPILLLCGKEDPIDPIGQCTSYYRALKRAGAETELVVYPREPHGFREVKHRIDTRRRMVEWFEKYLK